MGNKRQKLKAALTPSPPPVPQDNAELIDDLLGHLDNPNPTVQTEAAQVVQEIQANSPPAASKLKKSSKQRFQERENRRMEEKVASYAPTDSASDARIEMEVKQEEQAIRAICLDQGLEMFEIPPDGHCLFSAIADQLIILSLIPPSHQPYMRTRKAAADYIMAHPADFIPFLPCPEGEDGSGATDGGGLLSRRGLEQYCLRIRDSSTWGGEPEIQALSRVFNVPIHVAQSGTPPIVVHNPNPNTRPVGPRVIISYHRRMYGLGEHYNSLRPKRTQHASQTGQLANGL